MLGMESDTSQSGKRVSLPLTQPSVQEPAGQRGSRQCGPGSDSSFGSFSGLVTKGC